MSWKTDSVVDACVDMQHELLRAKRALCAARRSGRDKTFNAYLAVRRLKLEVAKPALAVVNKVSLVLSGI